MLADASYAADGLERGCHATAQLESQRVLPEEFLGRYLDEPATDIVDPGGFHAADVRLVRQPTPDLVNIILFGRNPLDLIIHAMMLAGRDVRAVPAEAARPGRSPGRCQPVQET